MREHRPEELEEPRWVWILEAQRVAMLSISRRLNLIDQRLNRMARSIEELRRKAEPEHRSAVDELAAEAGAARELAEAEQDRLAAEVEAERYGSPV